jgi:Zn-dependent protease
LKSLSIFYKGGIAPMLMEFLQDPVKNAPVFIALLITLVISLTIHEFSHAKVADLFGDDTPRMNGRLTLNPLAHLDVFGSLMLLIGGFGYAKPVPINPYQLGKRSPAALMLVALAGPLSNFTLALLACIPIRIGLVSGYSDSPLLLSAYDFLTTFVFLNVTLAFFNLIPLAPLDGDKIADYFFPPSWAQVLQTIRPYGPMILIFLIFVLPRLIGVDILNVLIYPPIYRMTDLLIGGIL